MMSRRASPSARRITIARAESRVPVVRGGAPRAPVGLTRSGAGHERPASCTSAEVERSIAEGRPAAGPAAPVAASGATRWTASPRPRSVSSLVARGALVLYVASNRTGATSTTTSCGRPGLARGRAAIRYPVCRATASVPATTSSRTSCRSPADGRRPAAALIPFPPLPALVLLPFVAIWGFATDAPAASPRSSARSTSGSCWWMLGRAADRARGARVGGDAVLRRSGRCSGTRRCSARRGSSPTSSRSASRCSRSASRSARPGGAVDEREPRASATAMPASSIAADARRPRLASASTLIDGRQFLAGCCSALAATARLTVALRAPFLVFVGGGGSWLRRALSAGIGRGHAARGPRRLQRATTGHLFHPAYEYLYQLEALRLPASSATTLDWAIEDPALHPPEPGDRLLGMPDRSSPPCEPPAVPLAVFDRRACPVLRCPGDCRDERAADQPGLPAGHPRRPRGHGRQRLVTGAGDRDRSPSRSSTSCTSARAGSSSATASATTSRRSRWSSWRSASPARRPAVPAVALIGASIAINAWGVDWGVTLGW